MNFFEWGNSHDGVWYFNHHGDYSGEVTIAGPTQQIHVPAAALIAFAAEFVRCKRIQELENATDREIFGLKAKT